MSERDGYEPGTPCWVDHDTPIGRFAVLADPHGASFAVIVLADPAS